MNRVSLIMISAMYENGGNTMHRMLDGHPELLVYPFESQLGTGLANDYLGSFVPIRYRWSEFSMNSTPDQDYEAFWDEELKTYLRVPARSKFRDCGLRMDEARRKGRFVELAGGRERNRANLVEAFFQSTFDSWENLSRSGRERYYVGYNPIQVLDAEKMLADFPTGHMIHVVRNPYSGYADQFRRPFPPSLERYAHTWAYAQMRALSCARKYGERFHIVRFEDLVADRESTMRGLLDSLGLARSEACLAPSFNGVKLGEIRPWGTIRTATPEENLATANELNNDQKRAVRDIAWVMIDAFGYEKFLETASAQPIRTDFSSI